MVRSAIVLVTAFAAVGITGGSASAAANLNIMALGDSIPYGFNTDIVQTPGFRETDGGWRAPLYVNFLEAGYNVDMLGDADTDPNIPGTVLVNGSPVPFDYDNEGHIGWQIDGTARTEVPDTPDATVPLNTQSGNSNTGLLEYVTGDFFNTNLAAADVVILQIGANDLRRGILNAYSDGSLRGNQSGHDRTSVRMNNLVAEVAARLSPDAMLLVANASPVAENDDPFNGFKNLQGSFSGDQVNDGINVFNSEFEAYFDNDGNHLTLDNVMLVDAWSFFFEGGDQRGTYLHPDGLHWLTPANEAFAEILTEKIESIIPEPASLTLCLIGSWACLARRGNHRN